MPRTQESNKRIRQISIEKIRNAAMELFIKQGYHATSIGEIAKNANISKGLLYNYYKGKEELLATMVEVRISELIQVMDAANALKMPADQLKYIVEGAIDNVQQKPEVFRFYLHLQTQPKSDQVLMKYSKQLIEENARQFQLQCKMFERLGVNEPIKRSLYFSSTLQGIMLMISTYPDQFPIEDIKAQIIHEFCSPTIT
ncbi:TetR/AcrR family transcriptional regulator [Shimazuella kribbensis]|uniref:TetR/AcrR family transcriptional regulator n=1 Tax=Shimazuella kribbensis TaxID=139808 RepID=UPI00040BA78F|nr:TetR/AcrR family transcriptional regulator [Shimazuella kribbensis]